MNIFDRKKEMLSTVKFLLFAEGINVYLKSLVIPWHTKFVEKIRKVIYEYNDISYPISLIIRWQFFF